MSQQPFCLHLNRTQSQSPKPSFSLSVSAEMTPEFEKAAKTYGYWNEVIYADPKLSEQREELLQSTHNKAVRRKKLWLSLEHLFDGPVALFLFPIYMSLKITKWVVVLPFKLLFWIFAAKKIQETQILRFFELQTGKTITTQSIMEIIEAEEMIKSATERIQTEVLAATGYGSEGISTVSTV